MTDSNKMEGRYTETKHPNETSTKAQLPMSNEFSVYPKGKVKPDGTAVMNCYPICTTVIERVYKYIVNEYAKAETDQLRTILDKEDNRRFKLLNFRYATFSCQATYHNKASVTAVTPFLVLDYDEDDIRKVYPEGEIGDIVRSLIKQFVSDRNFCSVLCFTGPNGNGVKNVVYVGNHLGLSHKECFDAVAMYFKHMYHIEADKSGSNIDRACYLPYDPDAYLCTGKWFEPKVDLRLWLEEKRRMEDQHRQCQSSEYRQRYDGDGAGDVFELVERWVSRDTLYVPGSYNRYVSKCGYLLCEFGVSVDEAESWAVGRFDDYNSNKVKSIIRSCYRGGRFGTKTFTPRGQRS